MGGAARRKEEGDGAGGGGGGAQPGPARGGGGCSQALAGVNRGGSIFLGPVGDGRSSDCVRRRATGRQQ